MSNTKTGRIFLSPPSVGAKECAAVKRAFDSGYVAPCGPQVDEFERRLAALAGRRYAVAVSSGTAAIDLVMAELGVDSSWTVIAPTLTFIATVGPAFHRGARLVFVDCDATGNIDVALLEEALESYRVDVGSHRVKVGSCRGYNQTLIDPNPTLIDPNLTLNHPKTLVIGVDLYGACCDYGAISKLCRRCGAIFVDDAAEAVGATWKGKSAGSAGLAGIYSFNGNKIITTGGGGAVTANNPATVDHIRYLSTQAKNDPHYYIHDEVGYNYRMTNLQAALGVAQMEELEEFVERKQKNFELYKKGFEGFKYGKIVDFREGTSSNKWFYSLEINRDLVKQTMREIITALEKKGIQTRAIWGLINEQKPYLNEETYKLEMAPYYAERILNLPCSTQITEEEICCVIKEVKELLKEFASNE